MKKVTFKSYEELPLMLSVLGMAAFLGISRAGAYELARTKGFPALKIGTRIVIPKDKLKECLPIHGDPQVHSYRQHEKRRSPSRLGRMPCVAEGLRNLHENHWL